MATANPDRYEPDDEDIFMNGFCGAFAQVLHEKFPWPVGAWRHRREDEDYDTVSHAVALPKMGYVADVKGIRKKENAVPHNYDEGRKPDEIYLDDRLTSEELGKIFLISYNDRDFAAEAFRQFRDRFPEHHADLNEFLNE